MGVAKRSTDRFERGRAAASAGALRGALALAAVSLLAAVVGALGPADAERTTYSWPPQSVPARNPARLWYSPLLLIRQQPESLSVRIPCSLPPELHAAEHPTTVVATSRNPETAGGLGVTRAGDLLTVHVGAQVIAELKAPRAATTDESCAYRLQFDNGRWSIEGGPDAVSLDGSIDPMPVVFGLFSGLDIRSPRAPTIDVTTAVHDTRTTTRQAIAWLVAVICLLAALLLLAGPRMPARVWSGLRTAFEGAAWHAHLADAIVGISLVGWWIVAPVVWDDGWVVARERTFSGSGGFSTYYNAFGVNLPLDYWVEWLHHWVAERTSDVPLLRLHALVALAAGWVLCRWAFSRVTTASRPRWDPALWALASAYLVVAFAWDMTIRPEPVTAVLATGVAACAIRFAERETVAPLAIAALLVPLALTAHHTGIVALAPVLAVSPRLGRWARGRLAAAGTLLFASISWALVLAFVGSDAGQRLADARTTSTYGITSPWRDELHRYVLVDSFPWATPLRRASVALIGLALLAFGSRRRTGARMLDLPATMLAIALVLLVVTPSKIPWHFGVLAGLLALTVGAEVARLRDEESHSDGWRLRPYLVLAAVTAAAAWAWSPRVGWNPLDLRTLSWDPGLDAVVPFSTFAIALPGVVLGLAMLVRLLRRRPFWSAEAAWRVAAWAAPMFAGPLILFTVGVLAADLVRTDSWTFTRQNLGSIVGRPGCGVADDALASLADTASQLPRSDRGEASTAVPEAWVPAAPVEGLHRFELSNSSPATPWFGLPADRRLGLFVAGAGVSGGSLELQWGRLKGGDVEVLRSDVVGDIQPRIETGPWTFVAASELPPPHPLAELVRIATPQSTVPGAPIAVSAPVTYATGRLSRLIREEARTLIHPNLMLYVPCARQPRLADGIVEPPRYFVWFDDPFQPLPFEATSPFLGVHDLYSVQRLPLTDGLNPPLGVVVYEVEQRIPGADIVPPEADTHGS